MKISTEGPYREIPGTDGNMFVNQHGIVCREDGYLKKPVVSGRNLFYHLRPNGHPTQMRRTRLVKEVWGATLSTNDAELGPYIREMVQRINEESGFFDPDTKKRKGRGYSLRQRKYSYRDKPCPDGRSGQCHGTLPQGYYFKCPACWNDTESPVSEYEFPGMIHHPDRNS